MSFLYVFEGAAILILGAFISSFNRSDREFIIMDERTDVAYIADERTYKEWKRICEPPADRFFCEQRVPQQKSIYC